jgi:predicted tellurium resistance membrane protein TerC
MDPQALIAGASGLATLTVLELVLGIDNIIFLSIVSARLPEAQRPRARRIGLGLAVIMRIALLFGLVWLVGLARPLFTIGGHGVSVRDLILMAGGLFLLAKATTEIHHEVEGEAEEEPGGATVAAGFAAVVGQIVVLDMVFSLDSIFTAVGMVREVPLMVAAILIAVGVMLFAAGPVSDFVTRHPTVKMLALGFLFLIGTALIADGLHFHIPRGYLYAAVSFSLAVEALNLMRQRRRANRRVPEGGEG